MTQEAGILDKIKDAASTTVEKAADFKDSLMDDEKAQIALEMKDKGYERVQQIFQEIGNSAQIINHSGFNISGLSASLGLPPEVSASFSFRKKITEEERVKVLEEAEEKKMVKLILKCLFKASDFYDKIQLGGYKLGNVNIIFGLMPGISITFDKIDQ